MWTFGTSLKSKLKRMLNSPTKVIFMAFAVLMLADGLDIVSSIGSLERNPFARDALHRFDWVKGLQVKLIFELGLAAVGYTFYKVFKPYSPQFGAGVAASVFLIQALEVLTVAAIPNLLYKMGFYVP